MNLEVIRRNRWAKRGVWAASAVLALWLVGWVAVPPLVKSQMIKAAREQLGRQVSIGAVDFRPWTLEVTVSDVAVLSQDGSTEQLRIKRIYIDAELESLLRLAPVVNAVSIDEPVVKLTHLGGGRYDIDDILVRLSQPSARPAQDPARFALYNLAVSGGSLDFIDKAVGKTQRVRDLNLSLPFLSNLDSQREVKVEPRLALTVNGSRFDSAAAATPFTRSRKTDASLKFSKFDLRPFLGYVPAAIPVKVQSALLDIDLKLAFEQSPRLAVKISGIVQAGGVKVTDLQGRDLLAFDSVRLALDDLRPFERMVRLSDVQLVGPHVELSRDQSGRLNLSGLEPASREPAASMPGKGAPVKTQASDAWKVTLAKLAVRGGSVKWSDATTSPKADMTLRELVVDASGLALPMAQPMLFNGLATLDGKQPGRLGFGGSATDQAATATLTVTALPLTAAAPYLANFLHPSLSGSVSGELGVLWKTPDVPGHTQDLQLSVKQLSLDKLALSEGKAPLAAVQKIELADAVFDLPRRGATIGKLVISQPKVPVQRGDDRRWMFERWLKPALAGAPANAQPQSPWTLAIADMALSGGNVQFQDLSGSRPVNVDITALQVQAKNLSLDGKKASPLSVSARVAAGHADPGRLDFRGALALAPLTAVGQVNAVGLPLHAFEPYFGDALNIEILRADAGFKGRVRYAQSANGPVIRVIGDAALEDFKANSVPLQGSAAARGLQAPEELLSWRALSLRGLDVSMAPGTSTLVDVKETGLSDFFARIVISETGRINLQDVVKASVPAGTSSTMAATATSTATAVVASAATSTVTASATPPIISFGPVTLVNGKVRFSDRFVRPNYSADLSGLNGKLSAFASTPPQGTVQLADIELRGRAEGTASLEVLGKINPLAKPLALDIKGKVRDLELAPLSPYAIKYAGHGIERGKLSLDVAYVVKPDGQLTASNKLVLNQLSFGEPVAGAPTSLPVKLAVALLADRNGVIDIDLPVSGSLNDPQFSLGPVIFKVIVNLIVKAITAPFSLLAGAFGGGGDELSIVSFPPGTAVLEPEAQKGLDKVAKALADRPALRMTVNGTASLEVERDAVKRERLRQLVQAERRRENVIAGGTSTAVMGPGDAEYPALLKEVYRRADIKKPRNMIGMAKDIPPAEMEALLLANVAVTDDVVRELAVQRGVAVRDYLVSKQLPPERLFLGAAKAGPPEAKWSPSAELNLATQ
ncbi:MAG: DUF748 domain-containing protein [Burkholderiaceae bacterium]|nr:DUF748 domain-containing protein [Burkholderiaceae bacterium]